jgi:hypothetical protein
LTRSVGCLGEDFTSRTRIRAHDFARNVVRSQREKRLACSRRRESSECDLATCLATGLPHGLGQKRRPSRQRRRGRRTHRVLRQPRLARGRPGLNSGPSHSGSRHRTPYRQALPRPLLGLAEFFANRAMLRSPEAARGPPRVNLRRARCPPAECRCTRTLASDRPAAAGHRPLRSRHRGDPRWRGSTPRR